MKKQEKDLTEIRKVHAKLALLKRKHMLKLIVLLDNNLDMSVSQIYKRLNVDQAYISQYLNKLAKCGWISTIKTGKFKYFRLSDNFYNFVEKIYGFDRNYSRNSSTTNKSTI